jgi:phytoene dehydrogenase-like protein
MEKSIIIIGAGLTGLSAGCYGQMNGYRTSIFEMHDKAGGVCTGWKRKGYTIDGAMNWLVGTSPENAFYHIWEELGATQDWKIFNHDQYLRIEDKDGKAFTLYCDADRLEQYLMELAPEDKDVIQEFAQGVRSFSRMYMPVDKPSELYGLFDKIKMVKMLPFLRLLQKWGKVSVQDFAKRFKNPYLREILPRVLVGGLSLSTWFMVLAWQHQKAAGYPIGGALPFVNSIERRYLSLGGKIHCNARVEKILVENDKAVGIKLADGTEHRGDFVISAADGRTTIFDMLGGKYIDDTIKSLYDHPKLFPPLVYIALGVARSFDDVQPSIGGLAYPLDKPTVVAGKEEKDMNVRVYNFDPTLSPAGKNVLIVQFNTEYEYWKKLSQEPERYKAEKDRIADQVIAGLNQRFPGIAAQIEMRDVATPVTWERYTGNWQGSYEGWMFSSASFTSSMSKTLPGLDNFYMAGQWVNPGGGMPTAAMSGRNTIQITCKKDKKRFITTKP